MKCQVLYKKKTNKWKGEKKKKRKGTILKAAFSFFIAFCPAGAQLKKKENGKVSILSLQPN